MHLVIGGRYQGKLDYAIRTFGIGEAEICRCSAAEAPELSKRCLVDFEEYVRFCLTAGEPVCMDFPADTVILLNDIFCGVVPMDPAERLWREETGRTLTGLAARAETVTRLFCGLPQRLK